MSAQIEMAALDGSFLLAAFAVSGACGWWAVAPFRAVIGFPLAVAPLAGLMLLPLFTLAICVCLVWPLGRAGLVAALTLSGASACALLVDGRAEIGRGLATMGLTVAVTALIAMTGVLASEILRGEPVLAFIHGTDHLGYAHAADWLRAHLRPPVLNSASPEAFASFAYADDAYASYVDVLYRRDPRFGSFALLALIAAASGRSGTFAYGLACTLVILTGAVGLAGVFARTRGVFLLLAVVLAGSPLYGWAEAGFLGKLAGTFSSALAARLAIACADSREQSGGASPARIAAAAALSAGAAILWNGAMTAVVIAAAGGVFVLLGILPTTGQYVRDRLRCAATGLCSVAMLAGVALLSSGSIARPLIVGFPALEVTWLYVFVRALGVDSAVPGVSMLEDRWHAVAAVVVLGAALLAGGARGAAGSTAERCLHSRRAGGRWRHVRGRNALASLSVVAGPHRPADVRRRCRAGGTQPELGNRVAAPGRRQCCSLRRDPGTAFHRRDPLLRMGRASRLPFRAQRGRSAGVGHRQLQCVCGGRSGAAWGLVPARRAWPTRRHPAVVGAVLALDSWISAVAGASLQQPCAAAHTRSRGRCPGGW